MMWTNRYTTASGSVYDVKTRRGAGPDEVFVCRVKLGEKHAGDLDRLARRKADNLDSFRKVEKFECAGIGASMRIVFAGDDAIRTNLVTRIEVLQ